MALEVLTCQLQRVVGWRYQAYHKLGDSAHLLQDKSTSMFSSPKLLP